MNDRCLIHGSAHPAMFCPNNKGLYARQTNWELLTTVEREARGLAVLDIEEYCPDQRQAILNLLSQITDTVFAVHRLAVEHRDSDASTHAEAHGH